MRLEDDAVEIRVAGPGDEDAITRVAAELDGGIAPESLEAISQGTVGSVVLAGDHAALVELSRGAAADGTMRDRLNNGATLPLLAYGPDGTLAGGLHAHPPWAVIERMLLTGWPPDVAMSLVARVAKVAQLWVDPAWRGRGVGAALLGRCCDIYFGADLRVVFGNLRIFPHPALERFYRSAGFRVVSGDDGVRVGLAGGAVVDVAAEGQGLFFRQRASWRRERLAT